MFGSNGTCRGVTMNHMTVNDNRERRPSNEVITDGPNCHLLNTFMKYNFK